MKKTLPSWLFILLVIITGIFIYLPKIDFQPIIAVGDHGRDLYAFERTLQGDKPYKDYWWVYGPIMPYYYALFIKLLSPTIMTVLFAQSVLYILTGIFIFLSLSQLIAAPLAYLGACWYWAFAPEFFYTYNHASAATLMMITTYCLFKYLRAPKPIFLAIGLLASFTLSLVKINFGLVNLICFTTSIKLIDLFNNESKTFYKKIFYKTALILVPLAIFTTYTYFLWGLTSYEIRQCLPYLSADHPYHAPILTTLMRLLTEILSNASFSTTQKFFTFLIILSIIRTISLLFSDKIEQNHKKTIFLSISILLLFYTLNLHEYLTSGVSYRTFWSKPFNTLLLFCVLGFTLSRIKTIFKFCAYVALGLLIFMKIDYQSNLINLTKTPQHFNPSERAKVFSNNDPLWIITTTKTTQFLKENLKENESFFALPYDTIYYYLTNKKSPSRQLIFFDHINIPLEQERTIIAELEKNNTNWILLSSRMKNYTEEGLGEFGKTYCPLLFKYIQTNFSPVAEFGDWVNEPGWSWSHGTRIYKRK